jgi:hypothetical protein
MDPNVKFFYAVSSDLMFSQMIFHASAEKLMTPKETTPSVVLDPTRAARIIK